MYGEIIKEYHSVLLQVTSVFRKSYLYCKGFPGGSVVKNLPAMQKTQVWSLGQEDPLEKEMATHSSILAWEVSWREETGCYSPWGYKELDTTEHACKKKSVKFSSFQSLGRVWPFATRWTAACQTSLYITNSQSLLKLISIDSVMPSNHLMLCVPFLLPH